YARRAKTNAIDMLAGGDVEPPAVVIAERDVRRADLRPRLNIRNGQVNPAERAAVRRRDTHFTRARASGRIEVAREIRFHAVDEAAAALEQHGAGVVRDRAVRPELVPHHPGEPGVQV